MPRSYHGTGEQAIQWFLEHSDQDTRSWPETFFRNWNEGNLEDEWPEFYVWLDAQEQPPKVGDG